MTYMDDDSGAFSLSDDDESEEEDVDEEGAF